MIRAVALFTFTFLMLMSVTGLLPGQHGAVETEHRFSVLETTTAELAASMREIKADIREIKDGHKYESLNGVGLGLLSALKAFELVKRRKGRE